MKSNSIKSNSIKSNSIKNNSIKIIILLLAFFVIFSINIYGSEYTIEKYDIDAKVNKDGSIQIEENLIYKFDENMNGVFRDIIYKNNYTKDKDIFPTSNRYEASNISNLLVYTSDNSFDNMTLSVENNNDKLSNGMNNVYSTKDKDNLKNIKVYSPVLKNNYKYIKYSYIVNDAVVKYNDCQEIYWNFFGDNWDCDIKNLTINLSFNGEVKNIKGYTHTYSNINNFNITDNNITVIVNNPNNSVDIRSVFNLNNITSKKVINENYNFEKLYKIEDDMLKGKQNYYLSNKIFIAITILYILWILYAIYKFYKETHIKYIAEINPDLPKNYSIEEYICLLNNTKYTSNSTIIAVVLDLVNKHILKMEAQKKVKKDLFSDIDYNYYVSLNTDKITNLSVYETNLLNYLFNFKLSNKIVLEEFNNKIELNDVFKKLKNKYSLNDKYFKLCEKLNNDNTKIMYQKVQKKQFKSLHYIFFILVILVYSNLFILCPLLDKIVPLIVITFINLFIYLILNIVISNTYKLKNEYIPEYTSLLNLKKYLIEYSKIKDRFPIEIVLWEKYLVFAVVFNIADKVSKEFKEDLISKGYDENYIFMNYPVICLGNNFNSISTTISSSTSTYSGTGSGGGRSDGGRWWRCFLRL